MKAKSAEITGGMIRDLITMGRGKRESTEVQHEDRKGKSQICEHLQVFGTDRGVASTGWQINTAFIERANLTIRQHVAAVGRRVITLCKGEDGLRQ
jgi:hypothetical protein